MTRASRPSRATASRSSSKGRRAGRLPGPLRLVGRTLAVLMAVVFGGAVYVYLTLPDVRVLRDRNPELTAFQALRAREARARGEEPRHVQRWVPYARISPHLKRAVLTAEDAKFWQHDGLDYAQIRESMEVNIERREFARGGSTITQQLAKNLYLSPSKNPLRKARELLIARRLEAELSKQRILEIYLNVIEWGDGIYGAESAARTYFGKPAASLGPQESALLAASLVNPRLLDPARPGARLRRRQAMIARRMGAVTPPPVQAASPAATPAPAPAEAPAPEPVDLVPGLPEPEPLDALPGDVVPADASGVRPCAEADCR